MLSELLTSKTRAELMGLLFNGNGEEHYLRGMEKLISVKISSIKKEVKKLFDLELLKSRKNGNRIYYSANQSHPLYLDLVSIVEKTVGLTSQLQERLIDNRIKSAFLFGSFAKRKETSKESFKNVDTDIIG